MKTNALKPLVLAVVLGAVSHTSARAAVDWRFPVGISFSSGLFELSDTVEDHFYDSPHWDFDGIVIPVGLQFSPYAEFDFGLGVGLSFGPPSFLIVYEEYWDSWGYYYDDTKVGWTLPVGVDVRYSFHPLMKESNICPYVRVGPRYTFAGGDFYDSADTVGFYGGVGVEFLRNKKISVAVEAGYDTSEVTVEAGPYEDEEDVTVGGFQLGVFAVF